KKFILGAMVMGPLVTLAATGDFVDSIIKPIKGILDAVIPLIVVLAVLFFFWGLVKFMMNAGEEKEEGRHIMIWGIIAIFVMVSFWGFVAVLQTTFGVKTPTVPTTVNVIPTVPST
ncbi:hypothetical protein ACFLY7_02280, partial [Patescibacteria group bacterium]